MKHTARTLAGVLALVLVVAGFAPAQTGEGKVAILAGKILTMDANDTVHDNAVLFLRDGKVEKIEPIRSAGIPADYRVYDHREHWIVPGLIDPHNHTATDVNGLNETIALTNPGLRAMDIATLGSNNNDRSLAGGVTTCLMIPGSATNMGGFGVVVRMGAKRPEDLIMKGYGSLKIAQAGNPERFFFGGNRSYMNYNLRQTLEKARAYHEAWNAFEAGRSATKPAYDAVWDGFRGLFRREFPASVHTQIYQVVAKTISMLHDEFGLKVMIDHGTFDGYKTAEMVRDRGMYAMIGPRVWWMDPRDRTINGCAASYAKQGVVKIGLNTDAGVLPQEDLPMQGAMAVRYGWKTYDALKGMTYWAADSMNLTDRIGSIAPGLEADVVAWTGDPIDFRSGVERVWVLGQVAYDASERRLY
ncbi:MAG: amidohydrolase family protein [Planctomycetota bacterium]